MNFQDRHARMPAGKVHSSQGFAACGWWVAQRQAVAQAGETATIIDNNQIKTG
jgi:hypothetical protein